MLLGYNTNGLAHHAIDDALELLASIGYQSVAITIDHHVVNPYDARFHEQLASLKGSLRRLQLRSVIETGARFLLDPKSKHEPTLVSSRASGRPRRIEFLRHAIDIAAELESDCVSLWSGTIHDGASVKEAFDRLVTGLKLVVEYAERREVMIGFEPEPGMVVDTTSRFADLLKRIDSPLLGLTIDIGHLHCLDETPIADVLDRWQERVVNIHIEDMRRGEHEHLMFGEGEIDFPMVLRALRDIDFTGGLHVELSRHSHEAPIAARRAFDFLRPLLNAENS